MYEFKLPDVGEGLHEAEIGDWYVREGDLVTQDQPLLEIETDKAAVEIPSPVAGRVVRIGFETGAIAQVGDVLVVLEPLARAEQPAAAPAVPPAEAPRRITASPVARKMALELGVDLAAVSGSGPAGRITADDVRRAVAAPAAPLPAPLPRERVLALPAARKLAAELGVDIAGVTGSGPQGRISPDDVRRHTAAVPAPAAPEPPTIVVETEDPAEVTIHVPLRSVRRRMAERMEAAWRVPHVSTFDEVDASALVALRDDLRETAAAAGTPLTYLPFIVKILVQALREFPNFNATLDMEKGEIRQHQYYHIGMATATPDGLVVPVIRHADRLSIMELAAEIQRLSGLARERKLPPEALRGSTFTVTNFGSFGGWLATPIINPPEAAILGFGRLEKQPVVVGDEVVARPVLPLALSFDHRLIDGADSGRFMRRVHTLLARPQALLLELR